jgi:hypothetical protein
MGVTMGWTQGDGGCVRGKLADDRDYPCNVEFENEETGEMVRFYTTVETRAKRLLPERVASLDEVTAFDGVGAIQYVGIWDGEQYMPGPSYEQLKARYKKNRNGTRGVGQAGEGVLFYASTRGGRHEILAVEQDDGTITIEEFKGGTSTGRSVGHNMVSAHTAVKLRVDDARNYDNIHYTVRVDNFRPEWGQSSAFAGAAATAWDYQDLQDATGKKYKLTFLPYLGMESAVGYTPAWAQRGSGWGWWEEFFHTLPDAKNRLKFLVDAEAIETAEIRKESKGGGTSLIEVYNDENSRGVGTA